MGGYVCWHNHIQRYAKGALQLCDADVSAGKQTGRGAILLFLLMQVTISCPDIPDQIGVLGPFNE